MSYTIFKSRWIGKRTDIDGAYRYQCVDLIRQYMHDELGLSGEGAWGNAIDYWTKTNSNVLKKFNKVSGTNAKRGDIVVFRGLSGNPYGHIGIIDANDTSRVLILEQNGSTGNGSGTGGDAIRLRWLSKSRIAGLLRIKGDDMATATDVKYIYRYGPLQRTADANGVKHYTGKSVKFIIKDHLASGEYKKMIAKEAKAEEAEAKAEAKQVKSIKDLTKALANQKNKKPEVVIKEVEKIVTKIQKVQVIKEVIKEVPAEINEQEVVQGFFMRLWNNLFKGRK
jgi:hypothetical protein